MRVHFEVLGWQHYNALGDPFCFSTGSRLTDLLPSPPSRLWLLHRGQGFLPHAQALRVTAHSAPHVWSLSRCKSDIATTTCFFLRSGTTTLACLSTTPCSATSLVATHRRGHSCSEHTYELALVFASACPIGARWSAAVEALSGHGGAAANEDTPAPEARSRSTSSTDVRRHTPNNASCYWTNTLPKEWKKPVLSWWLLMSPISGRRTTSACASLCPVRRRRSPNWRSLGTPSTPH